MKARSTVAVVFSLALLWAGRSFAEDRQAVESDLRAKEQAAWQAFADRDKQSFGAILTKDAVNISGGTMDKGRDNLLKAVSDWSVHSFSLSDFSYLWIDRNAVIVIYNATQDATCGGLHQPSKVIASSIWQRKGSKWVSPFHQETPAAAR